MKTKSTIAAGAVLLLATLALAAAFSTNAASPQIDQAGVIEVATFTLAPGVTPEVFRPFDRAVELEHVSKQPGFIAREAAAGDDGEWLVIVYWRSLEDADASMASFASASATADFMANLQPETMVMKRYRTQ